MKKILFIDFEDSFSYNVVSYLQKSHFQVDLKSWKEIHHEMILSTFDLLFLGPGPGHPDEYESIFPFISHWLEMQKPFGGVCLGHQIFWRIQGVPISPSKKPVHGQSIPLYLDSFWKEKIGIEKCVYVQRYNSLCVQTTDYLKKLSSLKLKNFIQDEEVIMTLGPKILTYQFHPESIGTSCPEAFFHLFHSII